MSFQVPLSSSPMAPLTPDSDRRRINPFGASTPFASNPSTTPAGPPPSSAGSFTPAGPPPLSLLGSSQPSPGRTLFKDKSKPVRPSRSTLDSSKVARYLDQSSNVSFGGRNGLVKKNAAALPESSPLPRFDTEEDAEGDDDEDLEEYSDEDDDESFDEGIIGMAREDTQPTGEHFNFGSTMNGALAESSSQLPVPGTSSANSTAQPSIDGIPRGVKRPREDAILSHPSPVVKPRDAKAKDPNAPSIAQGLAKRLGVAPLEEPDDLIIGTEECISALYAAVSETNSELSADAFAASLSDTCERLCNLWNTCRDRDTRKASWRDEMIMGIGPDESAPSVHRATFLSTLLLSLHHPAAAKGDQALAMSRLNRSTLSSVVPYSPDTPANPVPYPKILFDWLDRNHNPYHAISSEVQNYKPNATAHDFYWDIMYKLAIRGEFADLIVLLKKSDFSHACTAKADGHVGDGYPRIQLENVNMVIGWAIQALQACPALTDDDWQVTGNSWIIFRRYIEKAMDKLIDFAEGRDKDLDPEEPNFEASNFGLKSTTNDLSRSSRRAESRVPWSILQNLKTLYGVLLGGSLEILSCSENWVEGTIALTALWGGEDDEEILVRGLATGERSLRQSRSRGPRLIDTNPGLAYRTRMKSAFERVVEGSDASDDLPMLPDTGKPLEVALSSVFEGDVDGALGILRAMSLPITNAIAEIGAVGGWLQPSPRDAIMEGFDEDDMDLLCFERSVLPVEEPKTTKTAIMKEYAEALFNVHKLKGKRGQVIEGWELSIAVLARLGVTYNTSSKMGIQKILKRLPLHSDARIDKILRFYDKYDMPGEGRKIVEQYADSVLENTENYGTALIYYSRAHNNKKIKDVLDLLISYSLVQSMAYPTLAALDSNLHALVFAPEESLEHLALLDEEGAVLLHQALTGYATLRRFYDLRDEDATLPDGHAFTKSPVSRKKAAVTALLAVINSAADNIHGGIYDETRGSVVSVDGLLALLGEALVFVNQSPQLLTHLQTISLLQAIEDISTVSPSVYKQCATFLHSTLSAASTTKGPKSALASPRQMLKKQLSSITSGSFSLVGSSLLDSQLVDAMEVDGAVVSGSSSKAALEKSNEGGEKAPVKRGWDWRMMHEEGGGGGGEGGGMKVSEDVLRLLRLGLARELARFWIGDGG